MKTHAWAVVKPRWNRVACCVCDVIDVIDLANGICILVESPTGQGSKVVGGHWFRGQEWRVGMMERRTNKSMDQFAKWQQRPLQKYAGLDLDLQSPHRHGHAAGSIGPLPTI